MRLAVIPARGGSKRIPHKNIRSFCGRPMIAWSIDAARISGCIDRVIVSTDCDEIAAVAQACGAEVPFRRPDHLADDHATTSAVLAHAVDWQRQQGIDCPLVCCLYATAPFVRPVDLRDALVRIEQGDCDFVFSATSFAFPISRAFRLAAGNRPDMLYPENYGVRSQDLDAVFHDAGQFYWGTTNAWVEQRRIFTQRSIAHMLPRYLVQDIDTREDWERAEWMFRQIRAQE